MQPQSELISELISWTVGHSGYEEARQYIGLSGIADCEMELFERYVHGSGRQGVAAHLKTRISYELEEALKKRMREMGRYGDPELISLQAGLVQGHTDGWDRASGELIEIKTVPTRDQFPEGGRIPNRHFWQVQAYLHYTKRESAQVIYLARASGDLMVVRVRRQGEMGRKIEEKLARMARACREMQKPACTCGRHGQVTDAQPKVTDAPKVADAPEVRDAQPKATDAPKVRLENAQQSGQSSTDNIS